MYCDGFHQMIFEMPESLKFSESMKYLDINLKSCDLWGSLLYRCLYYKISDYYYIREFYSYFRRSYNYP